jgi:hypothetical protein
MEIFNCGTLVIIKLANIKGMITCSSIRFDKLSYEITYFDGADMKTIWVHENEFEVNTPELLKIGYKK